MPITLTNINGHFSYPLSASTKGEMGGAWQKFERGEMYLFPFYEAFGRELSDAKRNNVVYKNYCKGKNVGKYSHIILLAWLKAVL